MKITKYLLLISTVICLTASCNKDDTPPPEPELPPLTTEGLNTLGCYINGEPWVAEIPPLSEIIGLRRVDAGYRPSDGRFGLIAEKTNKENTINENIRLLAFFDSLGSYDLAIRPHVYSDYINSGCIHYDLDTLKSRRIEIIYLDTINKTVSGKFHFTAYHSDCQDTVRITDGRFDVYY